MKEEEYIKVQAAKRKHERLSIDKKAEREKRRREEYDYLLKEPPEQYEPDFLADMDQRRNLTQDLRSRHKQLVYDLGGIDNLSYVEKSLIERSLWIEHFVTCIEKQLILNPDIPPDTDEWFKGVRALESVYSKLGLKRRAKEVESLTTYLKGKEQ